MEKVIAVLILVLMWAVLTILLGKPQPYDYRRNAGIWHCFVEGFIMQLVFVGFCVVAILIALAPTWAVMTLLN